MKKHLQKGFTLIEIVTVLVILGILSCLAVPKYYDLTEKAREKVAYSIAHEYQARLNGEFAEWLMDGKDCNEFIDDLNNQAAAIAIEMNQENQYLQFETDESGNKIQLDVRFEKAMTAKKYPRTIYLPKCKSDTSGS